MSRSKIPGEYSYVADQGSVDYMIACGAPAEMANKMLNTHWYFSIEFVDNKIVVFMKCDEMPCMNLLDSYQEGVEKAVDHPIFGGKGSMTFNLVGDNTYKTVANSKMYGKTSTDEVYTDEGVTMTITNEKGAKRVEKWTRLVNEEGCFKYEKSENLANFNKAVGLPEEFTKGVTSMCVRMTKLSEDTFKTKESFGSMSFDTVFTFNKEFTTNYPEINWCRTNIVTRAGPGQSLMVTKGNNGEREEWKTKVCEKGLLYEGTDKVSGQTCKIYLKRYNSLAGKFRMVTTSNYDEFGAAIGLPADMVSNLKNDTTATMTLSECEGVMRYTFNSKFMPMDFTFKWNEEFNWKMPGTNDNYKIIETVSGNKVTAVSKGPKFTLNETVTFNDTFAVQEMKIAGTNISTTVIMERI